MGRPRVIYQEWIVELGRDPAMSWQEAAGIDRKGNRAKIEAVNRALEHLSVDELEFIRSFYFRGQGYHEISLRTGKKVFRLESLHNRAIRKLKHHLGEMLGLVDSTTCASNDINCPICNHEARDEIDRLIMSKKHTETWRTIMKILRVNYGLKIVAPQILISHRKYHIQQKGMNHGTD